MTRDEIYDHLAQVYLGKRDRAGEKRKQQFNVWLVINCVITVIILASAFYGLTAFLTHRSDLLKNSVLFSLNNGPIRVSYDLHHPYPQIKTFVIKIPEMNVSKYDKLSFSIRGLEEGFPGVVKIILKNQKNETASFYAKDVRLKWQEIDIPFDEFIDMTDWTNLTELSFVLEAWNAEKKKGVILIDNVCFSSKKGRL